MVTSQSFGSSLQWNWRQFKHAPSDATVPCLRNDADVRGRTSCQPMKQQTRRQAGRGATTVSLVMSAFVTITTLKRGTGENSNHNGGKIQGWDIQETTGRPANQGCVNAPDRPPAS